jgi:hypothetical protein
VVGTLRVSAESCIRKAVAERGLSPGLVGLADAKAEDEAASRWADGPSPMEIESRDRWPLVSWGGSSRPADQCSGGRFDMTSLSYQVVARGVPAPPVNGGRFWLRL